MLNSLEDTGSSSGPSFEDPNKVVVYLGKGFIPQLERYDDIREVTLDAPEDGFFITDK